jgi:hypothetical protein
MRPARPGRPRSPRAARSHALSRHARGDRPRLRPGSPARARPMRFPGVFAGKAVVFRPSAPGAAIGQRIFVVSSDQHVVTRTTGEVVFCVSMHRELQLLAVSSRSTSCSSARRGGSTSYSASAKEQSGLPGPCGARGDDRAGRRGGQPLPRSLPKERGSLPRLLPRSGLTSDRATTDADTSAAQQAGLPSNAVPRGTIPASPSGA